MQESVTFRGIFSISSVFRLGEVDGLKDLLISGQVATTAFKEFPNSSAAEVNSAHFHLPLFQGIGDLFSIVPVCVFSLIRSVLFCAQGSWGLTYLDEKFQF